MIKNTLLNHYHCTFFLPLVGLPEGVNPDITSGWCKEVKHTPGVAIDQESYESFLYFTPTRRSILFDQSEGQVSGDADALRPMKEWVINPTVYENWRMELGMPAELPKEYNPAHLKQVVVFTSIKLYQFFNNIYLLAYTVMPEALVKLQTLSDDQDVVLFDAEQNQTPRYIEDLDPGINSEVKECIAELQLEAWLRFSRLARQLYPTFQEQIAESKIARLIIRDENHTVVAENPTQYELDENKNVRLPQQTNELLAPTLVHIASLFFGQSIKNHLHTLQVYDDRMFISVAYGLSGPQHDDATLQCIKTLIALTDRFADIISPQNQTTGLGYPYDPQSCADLIDSTELGLWNHVGGHYLFNDMVNGYLSSGSFFREIIATKHIPYIYDRMLVQALLYQASLRHYDQQLTLLTKQALDNGAKSQPALKKNQQEFIQFTNQYWFKELTNQMQGKEIFRLQQQGLQLQSYYQQIETELTRTHDYRLADNSENISNRSNHLALWGIWFALAALLPGYITFWIDDKVSTSLKATITIIAIGAFVWLVNFTLLKKK